MILTTAIPVYNGAKTITRALTSLYTSEKQPDRVVVFDDGSTDNTHRIVEGFRIQTGWGAIEIRQRQNAGYVGNSNRCLELAAETDYLHILHADDEVGRYFYSSAIPAIRRGYGLVFSQPILRNDATNRITLIPGQRREWDRTKFIKARRDLGHIYYCGVLLRTQRKGGGWPRFNHLFPQICDQLFWAEWVKSNEASVVEIDPYHCTYHQHEDSWTAAQKRDMPALVREEWRAILHLTAELNHGEPIVPLRSRCLFACRSVVKANEVRNTFCSHSSDVLVMECREKAQKVDRACIERAGRLPWMLGKVVVAARSKLP